jgi:hypothetical protein
MQDSSIQAQLAESKAEIARVREWLSTGVHMVHTNLSLVSLVPKWTGTETGNPLEEFLGSIDSAADCQSSRLENCWRSKIILQHVLRATHE